MIKIEFKYLKMLQVEIPHFCYKVNTPIKKSFSIRVTFLRCDALVLHNHLMIMMKLTLCDSSLCHMSTLF